MLSLDSSLHLTTTETASAPSAPTVCAQSASSGVWCGRQHSGTVIKSKILNGNTGNTDLLLHRFITKDFVLLRGYDTRLILSHIDIIRHVFLSSLRPDLISKVQTYLHSLNLKPNPVFISVHVRRTDYINWIENMFNGKPVTSSFYLHAMSHFFGKFSNPIFLITSDDLPWCKENLVNNKTAGRILFPSDNLKTDSEEENAAIDLVTLAQANHSSKGGQIIVIIIHYIILQFMIMAALGFWGLFLQPVRCGLLMGTAKNFILYCKL